MVVSTPLPPALLNPKCCMVCGRALPDRTGLPGRPTDFCSPVGGEEVSACGRLNKRFNEVAVLALKIVEDIEASTEDAAEVKQRLQKLKGYLWSEANTATNRGKLVGATGRKRYGRKRSGWWRLAPE